MGQKIVISEDDVKNIKKLYGILKEDGGDCNFKNWVNGDGISKPKITYQLTNENGVFEYEGPEKGFCIHYKDGENFTGDTIHQLSNVVIEVLGNYLKENYKKGIFLSPMFEDLKMTYTPDYFKIEFDIYDYLYESMASTHVDHRGGLNQLSGDIFYKKLKSVLEANPLRYDIRSVREGINSEYVLPDKTKSFIKENWIAWRDDDWAKKNPPIKPTSVTTINQPIDNNSNQPLNNNPNQKIDTMSTNEPETKQTNKTDDLSNKPTVSQTNTPKETPVSPKTKVKIVNGKIVKVDN